MRRIGWVAVLVVAVTAAAPAGADHASLHWPTGKRMVTVQDRTGDPAVRDRLQRGVDLWNEAGADFRLVLAIGPADNLCAYTGTTVPVCFQDRTANDPAAQTYIGNDLLSAHMNAAYVVLNTAKDYSTAENVLIHELGHVAGLNHSTVPGSVMNIGPTGGMTPNDHDRDALRQSYVHADGSPPGLGICLLGLCL